MVRMVRSGKAVSSGKAVEFDKLDSLHPAEGDVAVAKGTERNAENRYREEERDDSARHSVPPPAADVKR